MPKNHTNSYKQKNKAFKGDSKRKSKQQATKILKRKIAKQEAKPTYTNQMKAERQETQKQDLPTYELDLKRTKKPKIVVIIPFNEQSITQQLKLQIIQYFQMQSIQTTSYITQDVFLTIPSNGKLIKTPIQFIFCERNVEQILDACKVADIICPMLSCKHCNTASINLDPYNNANAFDQFGYTLLSNLRAQGLPPTVCIIQDLMEINQGKRTQVKKLFTRFFESEFSDSHIIGLENQDMSSLIRILQSVNEKEFEWRDSRGYMLPEEIEYVNNQLIVTGIWRGKIGINPNQLIHITGLDDFAVSKIELIKKDMEECFEADQPESLDPLCRNKQNQEIGDELLKDLENMGIEEPEEQEQEIEMDGEESDISYDENVEDEKKPEKYELIPRAQEDLDYEDEVEYDMETKVRERYAKYMSLKNMRSTQFDPLTFLPDEADLIYNLRFLKKIKNDVIEEHKSSTKIPAGLRVKIIFANILENQVQTLITPNRICVLSGLLKYERKLTQMHVKIQRHQTYEISFKSKEKLFAQIGFRRAIIEPIFSRILTNTNKTKYVKNVNDNEFYLASFYFYATFPPQPVIFWQNQFQFRSAQIMAQGEIARCDQFQVILKRIILTGYPIKINKRKAVVRMMFHNPEDIKFFKPVELQTKYGLKGNITEPLGTHGLMKCMFNNYIKPNDIVSMALYKRVHPKFPKSMNI